MNTVPVAVLVLSGKRKSGKDYVAQRLLERFGEESCVILRLSGPLKKQYAIEKGLNYERLLDASDYKEQFRSDMIQWGEEKRNQDPEYFCRLATAGNEAKKSVWIISDARRKTDLEYFRTNFKDISLTVRVVASEQTRISRGYVFTQGVDDAESECGLDDVDFDVQIHNDGDNISMEKTLQKIVNNVICGCQGNS